MDQIPTAVLAPILVEAVKQGINRQYAFMACFTLLLYDNLLTLADEVELIWKRKFSASASINRYYSLAALAIGCLEDLSPAFTATSISCQKMILYQPLAIAIPLTFFPNFVIALRVYALYGRNKHLAALLITYLLGEFGVALWVYLTPSMYSVQLPGPAIITNSSPVHVCLAHSSVSLTNLEAAAFQFAQTAYDSFCLVLVLYKSVKAFMNQRSFDGLHTIIATHGVAYYMVVFTSNISWALLVLVATTGLKYSMARLAPLAANKLTLSLRSYGKPGVTSGSKMPITPAGKPPSGTDDTLIGRHSPLKRRGSWIGTSTFEVPTMINDSMELKSIYTDFSGTSSETE
ncbi:hypothetical protein SCHPADRAFT_899183 [Schizopora paradoxa]|uniref:DUF6533 domain-containing protein n=1 Tax=Schizopora paradoxa TaxID=27342 RepID=A0A0H2S576_9AGAM|nr:hypothetical protein SCHPADRAFT_899183 [Schizopora paradoxa]